MHTESSEREQLKVIADFLNAHNIIYKVLDVIQSDCESGRRYQYELRTPADFLSETYITYVTPVLEVILSEVPGDMTFRALSLSNDTGAIINSEHSFGEPQNAFTENRALAEEDLRATLLELFKFNRDQNKAIARIESHLDAIQGLCAHYDIPMADFVNVVYDFNYKKSDQNSWTFG